MRIHWTLLIVLFALALTGCGVTPVSGQDENPHPMEPSEPPEGASTEMEPTPTTPGLQDFIEQARENLAQRLSIPSSQINLVDARDVVWPNSSLGCPQEGMVYADVLTPGYLIILSADNRDYEYHTSKGTEVIYCVNPTPPVEGLPDST